MQKIKKDKIDIRQTKSFKLKRAKELGITLNQYLGIDPIQIIYFNKAKKINK